MLHWAEIIDKLRVFPRLFLTACFVWAVWLSMVLTHWYTTLPKEDRSLEATGFGSIVFVAVLGFLKMVYQTYSDAGSDWSKIASHTTEATTVTTSTSTPVTP